MCGSCVASDASNACTSCDDEKLNLISLVKQGNGVEIGECACKPGYHLSTDASATCVECHKPCKTCTSPSSTECLSCWNPNMSVNGGECKCNIGYIYNQCTLACESCEDGKYADSENDVCIDCHPTCGTCNGPNRDNCLSCDEPYIKLGEGSPHACGCDGAFAYVENKCVPCHSTCLTCYSNMAASCLTCPTLSERAVKDQYISTGSACLCTGGQERSSATSPCRASPLDYDIEVESVEAGCVWTDFKLDNPNYSCKQFIYPYCCQPEKACNSIQD